MPIPRFVQSSLASYDLERLDLTKDKKLIITEVLNKGDGKALTWLTNIYSEGDIKDAVASPVSGMWLDTNLSYWEKMFRLKLSPDLYKKAVIDLNS